MNRARISEICHLTRTPPRTATALLFVLIGCGSLFQYVPSPTEPPPEPSQRKKIALLVREDKGSGQPRELMHFDKFQQKIKQLMDNSFYFAEVVFHEYVVDESYTKIGVDYYVRQIDLYTNSLEDSWDAYTQTMCCLTGGIFPRHERLAIGIDFSVTDPSGIRQSVRKDRTWGVWTWQPYLVPVYGNLGGRLQSAFLELLADAMAEARRNKLI